MDLGTDTHISAEWVPHCQTYIHSGTSVAFDGRCTSVSIRKRVNRPAEVPPWHGVAKRRRVRGEAEQGEDGLRIGH